MRISRPLEESIAEEDLEYKNYENIAMIAHMTSESFFRWLMEENATHENTVKKGGLENG